jgi:hypothetical protein
MRVPREIRNIIYTYLHRLWSVEYMTRAVLDCSHRKIGKWRCVPARDKYQEGSYGNDWREPCIHSKCDSWFENKDLDPWQLEENVGTQFANEQAEHYYETTIFRFVHDNTTLLGEFLTRNRLGFPWRPAHNIRSLEIVIQLMSGDRVG